MEIDIKNVPPPVDVPTAVLSKQRAISLFKQIPKNRSCSDAYIELHWCACLNWQPILLNDTNYEGLLLKLANSIVVAINKATNAFRHLCFELELDHVNWAMRLRPHKDLLRFKNTRDMDGFLADMSDDTKMPTEETYQLQVVLSPGQSLFEASVSYNLKDFTAETKLSQVSRINKYGTQANCIYDENPEIRKYCYCRNN